MRTQDDISAQRRAFKTVSIQSEVGGAYFWKPRLYIDVLRLLPAQHCSPRWPQVSQVLRTVRRPTYRDLQSDVLPTVRLPTDRDLHSDVLELALTLILLELALALALLELTLALLELALTLALTLTHRNTRTQTYGPTNNR